MEERKQGTTLCSWGWQSFTSLVTSSIGENVVKEELSSNGSNFVRPDKMEEDVQPSVVPLSITP